MHQDCYKMAVNMKNCAEECKNGTPEHVREFNPYQYEWFTSEESSNKNSKKK